MVERRARRWGQLDWAYPLFVVAILTTFGIYAFWSAWVGEGYLVEPYLSPFYSPFIPSPFSWLSPAFLILWIPLGFRATCYYYRKAYYRSYFLDPPSCARRDLGLTALPQGGTYKGETAFPWILNNLHRFFLYLTIVVVLFLAYDALRAFWFPTPQGGHEFGIGAGTILFVVNVLLLGAYTFGCHSLRHAVGGRLDCFSCSKVGKTRHGVWKRVTWLNERHELFAWASLGSVWLTDVYVKLLSLGVLQDIRVI